MLENLERLIDQMPGGPERNQYLANFQRMRMRLAKVAENVAARAPFSSADEVRAALDGELRSALAEFHGAN